MRLVVATLIVVAALLSAAVLSQAPAPAVPGLITGIVVDVGGLAVPGASVELMRGTTAVRTTMTDARGTFRFEGVPSGRYRVRARLGGYRQASVTVIVADAPLAPMRLALAVEEVRASAEVTADAPIAGAASSLPNVPASAQRAAATHPAPQFNTEAYSVIDENAFHLVTDDPLSTFSIDVDTASYANVRRFLNDGTLPPADAVRVEELINYFRFDYGEPIDGRPFSVTTELGPAPWAPDHQLVLVGLQAPRIDQGRTPPRNLVFLLDVSGSMSAPDKLPLVRTAMRMLTSTLTDADRVAVVVYAGASGVALPSTAGDRKAVIDQAIAELSPGGSTNGAAGIRLAYDLAADAFIPDGINRVILATDGDFNVGTTSEGELVRLIEEERERGVFLSVLGVGTGNLKDSTMERLADRGNGNYSYLDSLHEARRVLIAEAGATLVAVAKDVKIQVEFNPARVGAYRLVGYENRLLADRDFNDDTKDAGEIGAGHTVTALYELVPPDVGLDLPGVDPLHYQTPTRPTGAAASDELLTVKLRYKAPSSDTSELMRAALLDRDEELSPNLGFAAAVAEFGMLLRESEFVGAATWDDAADLARRFRGDDPDGYRAEFVRLVELAGALAEQGD